MPPPHTHIHTTTTTTTIIGIAQAYLTHALLDKVLEIKDSLQTEAKLERALPANSSFPVLISKPGFPFLTVCLTRCGRGAPLGRSSPVVPPSYRRSVSGSLVWSERGWVYHSAPDTVHLLALLMGRSSPPSPHCCAFRLV